MLLYRPHQHEARYRSARRAAVAEVPWYREHWLDAAGAGTSSTVGVEQYEAQAFRFFPLTRPMRPWEDPPPPPLEGRALVGALKWAGVPLAGSTVFECRSAWLDPVTVSVWRRISYTVLLDPPLGEDPGGRHAALRASMIDRLARTKRAVIVADDGQRSALERLVDGRPFVRRLDLDNAFPPSGSGSGAMVVYDRRIGYLGGVHPRCRHVHLDWRTCWARNSSEGVAITVLASTRPRLVDVVPRWGRRWRAEPCPQHGAVTLVPHEA